MKYSDPDIIKIVEEDYVALDGLEKEVITYLKIRLNKMFNISDVVITLIK